MNYKPAIPIEIPLVNQNAPPPTQWFKLQIKTLRDYDLITNFPVDFYPINEEYVWFDQDFLEKFSWVNESIIDDQEIYLLKGNRTFLMQPFTKRTPQGNIRMAYKNLLIYQFLIFI